MEARTILSRNYSNPVHIISFLVITIILFLTSANSTLISATTTTSSSSSSSYIRSACSSTTYPKLCYNSLSPYSSKIKTNPKTLCKTALTVALTAVRNASSAMSKLSKKTGLTGSDAMVIEDCVRFMKDSIDELRQSLDAMGHLGGSDVEFQMSNIKTWVSAAITNENTCTDGFEGQKLTGAVMAKIKTWVLIVSRLTSNALSLINSLEN